MATQGSRRDYRSRWQERRRIMQVGQAVACPAFLPQGTAHAGEALAQYMRVDLGGFHALVPE